MTEKGNADLQDDVEAPESWLFTLSREFGRTIRLGKNGIGLLAGAACGAANKTKTIAKKIAKLPRRDRNLSSSEEALFEELGSKVAECPGGDYLSLKDDLEFWKLVKQIHSIRGKAGKEAVAEEELQQEEPQQDESSDSSAEDSESAKEIAEVIPDEEDAPDGATPEQPKTGKPSTEKGKPRKRERSPRSPRQEEGGHE
jgi:hypothetical protein